MSAFFYNSFIGKQRSSAGFFCICANIQHNEKLDRLGIFVAVVQQRICIK